MSSPLAALLETLPAPGTLDWIGLRRERRGPVTSVDQTEALTAIGLSGDHRDSRHPDPRGKRHLTLIQAEHLPAIASFLGRDSVPPELLRRNLVVSGINLLALKDKRFRIGDVLLEGTGLCHPCSRMEETFGPGGYHATRGHGGITARIVEGGTLTLGDAVIPR